MSDFPENVMEAAKAHLLNVLHDHKEMNPSELDAACGMDTLDIALGALSGQGVPENVFTVGMKELMDEGKVEAWEDGAGWHYRLSLDADCAEFAKRLEVGAKRLEWARPIVEVAIPAKERERLPFVSYVPIAEAIEATREEEREACARDAEAAIANGYTVASAGEVADFIRRRGETPQTEKAHTPTGFGQDRVTALQCVRRALRSLETAYSNNFMEWEPEMQATIREAHQALDSLLSARPAEPAPKAVTLDRATYDEIAEALGNNAFLLPRWEE